MSNLVKCLLCLKKMKKISSPHLKFMHNMTSHEYIMKFPDAKLTSDETILLMKKKMIGRKITWKNKISKAVKESWERGISKGRTGIPLSEQSKRSLSEKLMGHNMSEETRKKISESGIGRIPWNSGLTKEDDARIKSVSEKVSIYNLNMPQEKRNRISNTLKIKYLTKQLKPPCSKSGFRKDLGMYFRSTWEANFARVLLYNHKDIKYEDSCFQLSDNNGDVKAVYVSDFEVDNELIEIKGHAESSEIWSCDCSRCKRDKDKMNMFKKQYPHIKIKIFGKQEYSNMAKDFMNLIPNWEKSPYDRWCKR